MCPAVSKPNKTHYARIVYYYMRLYWRLDDRYTNYNRIDTIMIYVVYNAQQDDRKVIIY